MIIKAINKLDNRAAAGPDGVPALVIKKCKYVLAKPFSILWNASMKQGRVPKVFKHAFVIPILKPGKKRTEPESYRPVSLTSHIIKIFERILKDYMQNVWRPIIYWVTSSTDSEERRVFFHIFWLIKTRF